jgi:YD repeat-containing protein
MRMQSRRAVPHHVLRVALACLIVIALVPLAPPLLGTAASVLRNVGRVPIKKGDRLADRLPNLSAVAAKAPVSTRIPELAGTTQPCLDCSERIADNAAASARVDPANRIGGEGVDLYSGNVTWHQRLARLPGRANLDLDLDLVYNSRVWTFAGDRAWFDADRGFPAPGFQLGFPRVQGPFRQTADGPASYIAITTAGAREELVETAQPGIFASRDGSLLELRAGAGAGLALRTPDGSRLTFTSIAGQWQCTHLEDRNGNYLTASYTAAGHLQRIEDTAGRVITFVYNRGGSLERIVQPDAGGTRTLATFGYAAVPVAPAAASQISGLESGARVVMLTHLGMPDGSSYQFDYSATGEIARTTRKGPNGQALSRVSYEFGKDGTRLSAVSTWADALNDGQETRTALTLNPSAGIGMAVQSDGSRVTDSFGVDGWQRGLRLQRVTQDADGRTRTIRTSWQRVDLSPTAFRTIKQNESDSTLDEVGVRTGTVMEFTDAGLPRRVSAYRNDALVNRLDTDYVQAAEYVDRHILGLVAAQHQYDGAGQLISQASYTYDAAGSVIDQGAPLHHDDRAFGASFVTGRGLMSRIVRTSPAGSVTTDFTYNTAGLLIELTDSTGRHAVNSYADAYGDGRDRQTFAFLTSTDANGSVTTSQFDFATGRALQMTRGSDSHAFAYDAAGRLVQRGNLRTGFNATRAFDDSGTVITTTTRRPGATQDAVHVKVLDGAGLTRARAISQPGGAGFRASVVWRDAKGRRVRATAPVAIDNAWIAQEDGGVRALAGKQQVLNRLADDLDAAQRRLGTMVSRATAWIQPTVAAQSCEYYGGCGNSYGNDWFCGDEWGFDYYDGWTDIDDAFEWDDQSTIQDDMFWGAVAYLFGDTDPQSAVDYQLTISGYSAYITEAHWTPEGYSGKMDPSAYSNLINDGNFANGFLYGFHTDVGRNLRDFRSYTGSFGDGSLQIVLSSSTGDFHIDVDRFNPYQDVVNFFGHSFVEVLPSLFKKIF